MPLKKHGVLNRVVCEVEECNAMADFKNISGLKSNQCPHLRSIYYCKSDAIKEDLRADVLEELAENKWIGQEKKEVPKTA